MCTQHNPAYVSKPKQKTPAWDKREQPLLIPNKKKKKQLGTHKREPSLWELTKGCPIIFLSPSTWREQCPRAIISAEV